MTSASAGFAQEASTLENSPGHKMSYGKLVPIHSNDVLNPFAEGNRELPDQLQASVDPYFAVCIWPFTTGIALSSTLFQIKASISQEDLAGRNITSHSCSAWPR